MIGYNRCDRTKISSLGFVITSIFLISVLENNFWQFKLLALLVVTTLIGFFVLSNLCEPGKINILECILVSFTIGLAILAIASRYILIFDFFIYNKFYVYLILLVISIVFYILLFKYQNITLLNSFSDIKVGTLILLFASLIIADDVLRWWKFHFQLDPWMFETTVKSILRETPYLNYVTFTFSGLYYLGAFLAFTTGTPIPFLSKLMTLLVISLIVFFIWEFLKMSTSNEVAAVSAVLFLASPYVLIRLKDVLRENLALLFFSCFIYLLVLYLKKSHLDSKDEWIDFVPMTVLFSATILTQQIVAMFTLIFLATAYFIKRTRKIVVRTVIYSIIVWPIFIFDVSRYFTGFQREVLKSSAIFNFYIYIMFLLVVIAVTFLVYTMAKRLRLDCIMSLLLTSLLLILLALLLGLDFRPIVYLYGVGSPLSASKISYLLLFFGYVGLITLYYRKNNSLKTTIYFCLIAAMLSLFLASFVGVIPFFRLSLYLTLVLVILSSEFLESLKRFTTHRYFKIFTITLIILVVAINGVAQDTKPVFGSKHLKCAQNIIKYVEDEKGLLLVEPISRHIFDANEYYLYDKNTSKIVFANEKITDTIIYENLDKFEYSGEKVFVVACLKTNKLFLSNVVHIADCENVCKIYFVSKRP